MTFFRAIGKVPMYYNILELGHGEIMGTVFGLSIKNELLSSWVPFNDHFLSYFGIDSKILPLQ